MHEVHKKSVYEKNLAAKVRFCIGDRMINTQDLAWNVMLNWAPCMLKLVSNSLSLKLIIREN